MKIKHSEIEVSKTNPFANCALEREQYAKILTEVVTNYADGFVLAINNEWGTGKTTFVKMWQQHLEILGFQAVYFNAWENDFNSNPLVAIMSELKPLNKGKMANEKLFKSVIEKGAVLTKHIAPALLRSLLKKYLVDPDLIGDAIENATHAATEILEEEIKEYTDKKKTIKEFREELERFIEHRESQKPLVFIVDELDRCRPNYSVEVLEQLKHFFSVRGIVFVLSIDKTHLASSIKGFYGSEMINTDEYLRRFIDLEYSIPKPSNKVFCKYLFGYYEFDQFFSSEDRRRFPELQNEKDYLLEVAELLFDNIGATLRQQEKIFALTRLILNYFKSNQYTFSHLLFFLVCLKSMNGEVYQKIVNNKLPLQEVGDVFVNMMPLKIKNKYGLNLTFVAALLIHFYNNGQDHQTKLDLLAKDEQGNPQVTIKLNIISSESKEMFTLFERIHSKRNYNELSLKYLTDKINLTESIVVN